MTETEVNYLFGKDRVTKNGVYFEANLPDVAPLGWALRRHQLMKSVEKSTRAQFLSIGSLGPFCEVWVFRRTELALNASFTTSSALVSPRPSSPDSSTAHLNASGSVAGAHATADDDSNDKDTHPKSSANNTKAAPDADVSPHSPTGSTSSSGKKKKSKPKSPKSDEEN